MAYIFYVTIDWLTAIIFFNFLDKASKEFWGLTAVDTYVSGTKNVYQVQKVHEISNKELLIKTKKVEINKINLKIHKLK